MVASVSANNFMRGQVIGLCGEFGGAGKEEVTGEDGRGRRPARVQRGHAAAQQCAVDQVIVDQCRGVEQLHGGAEGDEFLLGRTQHISDEQAEGRSDAFASGSK